MSSYATALITGASSGLGRGLALAIGRPGTHVIAVARRKAQLDSLVAEISSQGGTAEALELDCADDKHTYATLRALDERRPIDLCIANAGRGALTPGWRLEYEEVRKILQLNVLGACATLSAVVPGMLARKRGHLVAVASLAGFGGLPASAAYSASKAALITFCESLRVDLRPRGLHVTTICPGYVRTEMTAAKKEPMPFLLELDEAVAVMMRAIARKDPMCLYPKPMALLARSMKLAPPSLFDWIVRRMNTSA